MQKKDKTWMGTYKTHAVQFWERPQTASVIFVCVIIPFFQYFLEMRWFTEYKCEQERNRTSTLLFCSTSGITENEVKFTELNSALNEACRMIVTWPTADVELLLWVTFTLTLVLFLWKKSRMKNFNILFFHFFWLTIKLCIMTS